MKTVFISYVSENRPIAIQIADVLRANGIDVWIDRDKLKAGQSWLDEIRKAISSGSYFIPVFSKEWNDREYSVANDELLIAVEELRRRPYNQLWIIPVKANKCEIPEIPVGASRTLNSIHHIDFSAVTLSQGYQALLEGLDIDSPVVPALESEDAGWPARLRIVRNDKYVDNVPIVYLVDGLSRFDSKDRVIELTLNQTGRLKISCFTQCRQKPLFQTRGGDMQGWYYVGQSDVLEVSVNPGHQYELFVCGDSIAKYNLFSPYLELVKMIGRGLGSGGISLHDPRTWPRIQTKFVAM